MAKGVRNKHPLTESVRRALEINRLQAEAHLYRRGSISHDCRSPISSEIDRLLEVENQMISVLVTEVNESIPLQDSNPLHESIVETPSEIPVLERVQRRTWVATARQEGETLEYVKVNEKLRFTADDIQAEVGYWKSAMVGFVLGANPPFQIFRGFIQRIWGDMVDKVISIDQGTFSIRFNSENDMQSAMSRGPILFDKRPVILKKWSPNLKLQKEEVHSVDIWICLPGLHVKYWGAPNLSKIAS